MKYINYKKINKRVPIQLLMGTPVEDIRLIETGDPTIYISILKNIYKKVNTIQNKYFTGNQQK